jgi:GAF domain-containing protein
MLLPDSLIPANDALRLQALAPYLTLGSTPDPVFTEMGRLTAQLFAVPIALVSLVEKDSVWFTVNEGLPGHERVARQESMCSVAILQEETTIYEDLRAEPCRLTDPQVAETLHLRFYAGHPLLTAEGHAIGTLCVIDRQPRTLSLPELRRLQTLAAIVMKMLDLRVRLQQQAAPASALWLGLYVQLEESLNRLTTLRELASWEENSHTAAAVGYQQSIEEEADRILRVLDEQTTLALTTLPPQA